MKRSLLVSIVFALLLFQKAAAQIPSAYAARLQFVLDSVASVYNIKGVSAAVTIPGLGTWEGTYGISATAVPMSPTMALGIGSNTKTFIAATILKLEEQSMLSLNDTVGTWIQHPHVNGQITITQLLNHTSGIYNFTNNPAFSDSMAADFTRVWQPQEILQFIGTSDFVAGTNWNYSNSNYLLLGMIITQVAGQPLSTVIRNNVLYPAGLNNTWLFPEETPTAPVANSWSATMNGAGPYLQDIVANYGYTHTSMFSMAWAAGAIMSTAADNASFWSKLITGQVLSPASLVKMKQMYPLSLNTGYGLGVFRYKNFNSRVVYSHGGTNFGFINENIADSISGVGISVLTNQDSVSNNILLTKVVAALHKVTINPPLSIDQLAGHKSFTVYPNPAKDAISISGCVEGKAAKLHIYDMTGKEVQNTSLSSYRNISLPALSNGTYLLKIESAETGLYSSQLLRIAR